MNNLIEIRWHGRGGQGAKTASLLLADAAFNTGKYIQGFPEYGPERMGAPITAYNRISDAPITIHSNIYEPDYVVVVDDTLLASVPVTSGLKKEGAIVINTTKSPEQLRELLKGYEGAIYTIDARKVSEEALGRIAVIDNITLEDWVRYQKLDCEVIRGYKWCGEKSFLIREVIQKLHLLRCEYKKTHNPLQLVIKLIMNSAYGKMIQKPITTEKNI